MSDPDFCDCAVAPVAHVHVSTQGELNEARAIYPHIWIEHDFNCTCSVHGTVRPNP